VSGQYTQTSGSALNSRAFHDTRGFPYTGTARLSAEEIFCLVSCPASTAKKYVLLVCDHGFFLVSLGYVPRGTLLSQVIKPCQTLLRQSTQKRGKTRNKRKRPMWRPENKNGQQGGQVRGVRKSHIVDPTILRSVLKNERGRTLEKTPSLEEPSPVIMACHIKIVAACTCCCITNTLCL